MLSLLLTKVIFLYLPRAISTLASNDCLYKIGLKVQSHLQFGNIANYDYFCFIPGPSCSKRRLLNELVKTHFVNYFSGFNIQCSDIV